MILERRVWLQCPVVRNEVKEILQQLVLGFTLILCCFKSYWGMCFIITEGNRKEEVNCIEPNQSINPFDLVWFQLEFLAKFVTTSRLIQQFMKSKLKLIVNVCGVSLIIKTWAMHLVIRFYRNHGALNWNIYSNI